MKNVFIITSILAFTAGDISAQSHVTDGFKQTSKGLWYKIAIDAKKPKAHLGDIVKVNIIYSTQQDSVLFSTYEAGQGPAQFTIAPQFNGDPMEGFTLVGEGDSAIFLMPEDSAYKNQQPPAFARKGEYIKIGVTVLSVMTKEQYEQAKAQEAQMQTQKDVKTIEDYLTRNNIHAQKLASSLYYVIEKQGDGLKAEAGKTVTVKYTGKFLDGKVFESSQYTFLLGRNKVIKGWDEGIALFNVGGKGTLIIPSAMGYGTRGQGSIPPNTILIFDIELLNVE